MDEEKPLMSIGDNGIEVNLKSGNSLKTDAEKIFMQGIKQNVAGGQLEHKAEKQLIQTGNTMKVSDGGKIINEVANGILTQTDNTMEVDEKSTIINKI